MNLPKKGFILLIFIFLFSLMPLVVSAESSINVKIDEGYDGRAKMGRAHPLTITLENSGNDFSGEMLIPFTTDYMLGGTKSIKIDLPANSKKEYTVIIPGFSDVYISNSAFDKITLFEGSRDKGKKVKFTGDEKLSPMILDYGEATIGLLTENVDRLKALQLIKLRGETPKVTSLDNDIIPEHWMGLQHFDLIVVDDYPVSLLSEEQQQAIISWMRDGGILLAGATAKGHHAWGQLASILPINMTDETTISDLTFFSVDEADDFSISSLNINTGILHQQAEVKIESESLPIVATNQVGDGEIWQIAFSLGEEPMASWSDYDKWLASLIDQTNYQGKNNYYYQDSPFVETYYSLGHVNELFPATQFSIGTLILILLGYLVIIVPILYAILLKTDKREHAWWIIPAISLVISGGIFGIGAKDRLASPTLSELGMYESNADGDLLGEYTASLFSNMSGEYQISYPMGEFIGVSVIGNQGAFGEGRQNGAIITEAMLTDDFHFPNVEYWSARSVVGKHMKPNVGKFFVDLELNDNQLSGTIENQFPYNFEEVFIWSGSDIYKLGSLQQGATLQVKETLKQKLLMNPREQTIQPGGSDLEAMKKSELEHTLIRSLELSNKEKSPIVFGYTKDDISNAELVNKSEKNDRLSLIYTPFTATGNIKGEFSLSNNDLLFDIHSVSGQFYGNLDDHNYIEMDNGIYDVNISLPAQLDYSEAEFTSLQFSMSEDRFLTITLLDHQSGDYIEIDNESSKVELTEDVTNFFSSAGTILIKVEKNHPEYDPFTILPEVTVKGAVK